VTLPITTARKPTTATSAEIAWCAKPLTAQFVAVCLITGAPRVASAAWAFSMSTILMCIVTKLTAEPLNAATRRAHAHGSGERLDPPRYIEQMPTEPLAARDSSLDCETTCRRLPGKVMPSGHIIGQRCSYPPEQISKPRGAELKSMAWNYEAKALPLRAL
jgi:hypothetical protein